MTTEEAIRCLRNAPQFEELIRDSYLDANLRGAAERFCASDEFAEVRRLFGAALHGASVLDLGAGSGIASYALARAGARTVVALEPDTSDEIGTGAAKKLQGGLPLHVVTGRGEEIPLRSEIVDIVYVRQTLHHARNLDQLLHEIGRVMRPGGLLLVTREHVVKDREELSRFLAQHPVHQLAGGENAYAQQEYRRAIRFAGLKLVRVFRPWETIINAFPEARSAEELARRPREMVERWLGFFRGLARVRLVRSVLWAHLRRPAPGALYSFLAKKP